MSHYNGHLAAVLDIAAEIQEDSSGPPKEADAALRYAVLKRIEEQLEIPAMVKYGDADSVAEECAIPQDRVWAAVPDGDYALFQVEPTGDLTESQATQIDQTMLAIGAWYIGDAGIRADEHWTHKLYVWPNDHPILQQMPRPP